MVHINDTIVRSEEWRKDALKAVEAGNTVPFWQELDNNWDEIKAAMECGAPVKLVEMMDHERRYLREYLRMARDRKIGELPDNNF